MLLSLRQVSQAERTFLGHRNEWPVCFVAPLRVPHCPVLASRKKERGVSVRMPRPVQRGSLVPTTEARHAAPTLTVRDSASEYATEGIFRPTAEEREYP